MTEFTFLAKISL